MRCYIFIVCLLLSNCSSKQIKEHNCRIKCEYGKCCMKCDDVDKCCCKHLDKCPCPPDSYGTR